MIFLHVACTGDTSRASVEQSVKNLLDGKWKEQLKESSCSKRWIKQSPPESLSIIHCHETSHQEDTKMDVPVDQVSDTPVDSSDHEESESEEGHCCLNESEDLCDENYLAGGTFEISEERYEEANQFNFAEPLKDDCASSFDGVSKRLSDSELLFDITQLAGLLAMNVAIDSHDDERHYNFLEAYGDESFSIHKIDWWERPYWAWTWQELMVAESALFLFETTEFCSDDVRVTVATNALVARLPFLTSLDQQHIFTVIHPEKDFSYIQQQIKRIKICSANDIDVAWFHETYMKVAKHDEPVSVDMAEMISHLEIIESAYREDSRKEKHTAPKQRHGQTSSLVSDVSQQKNNPGAISLSKTVTHAEKDFKQIGACTAKNVDVASFQETNNQAGKQDGQSHVDVAEMISHLAMIESASREDLRGKKFTASTQRLGQTSSSVLGSLMQNPIAGATSLLETNLNAPIVQPSDPTVKAQEELTRGTKLDGKSHAIKEARAANGNEFLNMDRIVLTTEATDASHQRHQVKPLNPYRIAKDEERRSVDIGSSVVALNQSSDTRSIGRQTLTNSRRSTEGGPTGMENQIRKEATQLVEQSYESSVQIIAGQLVDATSQHPAAPNRVENPYTKPKSDERSTADMPLMEVEDDCPSRAVLPIPFTDLELLPDTSAAVDQNEAQVKSAGGSREESPGDVRQDPPSTGEDVFERVSELPDPDPAMNDEENKTKKVEDKESGREPTLELVIDACAPLNLSNDSSSDETANVGEVTPAPSVSNDLSGPITHKEANVLAVPITKVIDNLEKSTNAKNHRSNMESQSAGLGVTEQATISSSTANKEPDSENHRVVVKEHSEGTSFKIKQNPYKKKKKANDIQSLISAQIAAARTASLNIQESLKMNGSSMDATETEDKNTQQTSKPFDIHNTFTQDATEEVNVVTPHLSRQTSIGTFDSTGPVFDKVPSPPRSPQIDSQGIDLTVLSQLPIALRSEARLAFLICSESGAKKKKGTLHKFMVEGSSISKVARISPSPAKRESLRKRKRAAIDSFFRPNSGR